MKLAAGWSLRELGSLAHVQAGAMVNEQRHYKDPVRLPYMRVANVQDGCLNLADIAQMRIEQHLVARHSLREGDVLLTVGGDADKLGRGDIWRGQIEDCIHQNHVVAVRTKQAQLLPEYLNALTASRYGKVYFLRCANHSTTLASINTKQVKEFPVLLPPLAVQVTLVQALQEFDAGLAIGELRLQNSLSQKQACLQQIFSANRSLAGTKVGTKVGTKSVWLSAQLKEVVSFAGSAFARSAVVPERFRYIEIADVRGGFISADLVWHTRHSASSRARRLVRAGDVLLSMVRPNLQRYARALPEHENCVASTGFAVLTPRPEVLDSGFLYHSLYSDLMQLQFKSNEKGSNYPQLNLDDVRDLELRYPALDEQVAIAELLDLHDQRIALERRALEILRQQKRDAFESLIQQAGGW